MATVVLLGQLVSVPLNAFSIQANVQNWPWKTVGDELQLQFSLKVLTLSTQPATVAVSNDVAEVVVSEDGAVVLRALAPPLALNDNGLVQGTVGSQAFPLTITVPFFQWQTTVQPGFAVSFDAGSTASTLTPAVSLMLLFSILLSILYLSPLFV